jgi:hypothetical protein
MIDFTKIRGFSGGQREAFEELVCQLARRENAPPGATFRRIEGAGGDGGIEAYWLLADGTKIGYQAKYFTRAGDIGWGQIDQSVEQAIETHPTLTQYVIAIPCNLTDRRGQKGKGQTGWELWESHRTQWQINSLSATGRTIEFIPWTASVLGDRLASTTADGLRRYWFNAAEFSEVWFQEQIRLAAASLEERYHPEDHVEVNLEKLFHFMLRDDACIIELDKHFSAVKQAFSSYQIDYNECLSIPIKLFNDLASLRQAWIGIKDEFGWPVWQEWNSAQWGELSAALARAVGMLQDAAYNKRATLEKTKENEKILLSIDALIDGLRKIAAALNSFTGKPPLIGPTHM